MQRIFHVVHLLPKVLYLNLQGRRRLPCRELLGTSRHVVVIHRGCLWRHAAPSRCLLWSRFLGHTLSSCCIFVLLIHCHS